MSSTHVAVLNVPTIGTSRVEFESHDDADTSAIQRLSKGVGLCGIPTFTSIDLKRQWMLEHLSGAFRIFARRGYVEGLTGHISLRDPGGATHLPAGTAGFQIHSHLHQRYPHINAACHTLSTHGVAYSTFGKRLEMLNLDVTAFHGEGHGVYNEFGGVTLTEEESDRVAASLGDKGRGLILRNHGLLIVGQTVDEAAYLFCLMEKSCEIQLLADAAAAGSGNKVPVSDDVATFTKGTMADPEALYCAFQPEYEMERAFTNETFMK